MQPDAAVFPAEACVRLEKSADSSSSVGWTENRGMTKNGVAKMEGIQGEATEENGDGGSCWPLGSPLLRRAESR